MARARSSAELNADPIRAFRRTVTLIAAVLALHGISRPGFTQPTAAATTASEQTIKAAFLYKFAEYVAWPATTAAGPDIPFTIGVLGSASLADDLIRVTADRTVDQRPIKVRTVLNVDTIEDLQVLFVAGEQRNRLDELLGAVRGRPILTVTESEGALASGSVINFTVNGDRVRFEVSLDAAQSNQLRLNSRLLAVAAQVYQSP